MKEVFELIQKFLAQKRSQPSLVIKFDNQPSLQKMTEIGFRREGDYWVISRKDAKQAIQDLSPSTIDWDAHWKAEKEFRREQIPTP